MFNEDLHHNIAEFDVHDGSHSLLLRPQQGRAKAHPEVAYCHKILLTLIGNTVEGQQWSVRDSRTVYDRVNEGSMMGKKCGIWKGDNIRRNGEKKTNA